MAEVTFLGVTIDRIPGIVRGPTITVSGSAACLITGDPEEDTESGISGVSVRLGRFGSFVGAKPTGPTGEGEEPWSTWTTDPLPIAGVVNDTLLITAMAFALRKRDTDTATAIVDRTPPVLTLITPDPMSPFMTQAVVDGKTTFRLRGRATDERSRVVAVEWALGQGQPSPATPVAPGDWSSWTIAVEVSPAGTYELQIVARDGEGNPAPPTTVTLNAVETFQPQDPSAVFAPAAYLDDLLAFTGKRIVDAGEVSLTPAMLTAAYHQRFADLTNPTNRDAATAPVHQVRVCVEVLRSFLAAIDRRPPAAEESKYRRAAYEALLSTLGTSFDEIRRARGDAAAQTRLAARLGIDRPDRLDQLMLLPAQATEARLEQLFGLQDTTRDSLVREPQPLLLTWQLGRLRAQWQEQDDAARGYEDLPLPIIDPDLLVETDFRTRNRNVDPAFALWHARRIEMTALLRQIDDLRKSQSEPLAAFDAVVNQFVTPIEDLTALFADYQSGRDVGPRLSEKRLSAGAFLHLMRSRDLAAAGTLLAADWADLYSIAAQVAKLGRYSAWREEERTRGLALGPDYFLPAEPTSPLVDLPEWRATSQERRAWGATLQTRIAQQHNVIEALRAVTDATEQEVLPQLRDLLATTAGDAARGLLIELAAGATQRTTRLDQAIETLQGTLFAVRVGAFSSGHPAAGWKLARGYNEATFDEDWVFWGAYEAWRGAMRVFVFPESHLLPTLWPSRERAPKGRTKAFGQLLDTLRGSTRITPDQAREAAAAYLVELRKDPDLPPEFQDPPPAGQRPLVLTERLTAAELAARHALSVTLINRFTDPHQAPNPLKEVFYFVPVFCAQQLQRSGEYVAALDWFQTVYAYQLPPERRQIYHGLTLDEKIPTKFERHPDWPRQWLNPHDIARDRAIALNRFVVISLVRCFEQFADAEFTRDTNESVARARALYQTALDLLGLAYPATDSGTPPANPFGLDPVAEAARLHAETNLRKLRLGRNIAGLERLLPYELSAGTAIAPRQPTPYRYAALTARARELVQYAAQMEAALLAALEKRDDNTYHLLKAVQDLELAGETVRLQELRFKEANDGIKLAHLQWGRASIEFDHFNGLLHKGVSDLESLSMAFGLIGSALSSPAGIVSGFGSLFGQSASQERREEEWRLQRDLALRDIGIGRQQFALAVDRVAVARQEERIARLQDAHARATVRFLAGKFTSSELYEFMSEVLDGVYRFFLQQATAVARLAENQLAFERQEPVLSVIQGDYYAAPEGEPDRRGMTGSARLLADLLQVDQHAFLTDRRKLQLTRTISLARHAPIEFHRFRETGVMIIGTRQELFDRDFPGHYLRLIKRVRTSVIALIPPVDGIHALLSTPGTSRVVIGGDTFRTVVVRRDPETVALSSPRDATGLFELVPDTQPELLLPFEGTGVDTVWRFELPKAANAFDYSTVADVLLTFEYTALNSFDYRQQVLQTLDSEISSDRPFSFRQQFPDQWYELHNPHGTATPMAVRMTTEHGDFLPNIEDPRIQHLLLYFAPANDRPVDIRGVQLLFTNRGGQTPVGGSADSIDGVISTRRANGSTWVPITGNSSPDGEWKLALPTDEATRNLFRNAEIADILFVITYSGRTPQWPD
jgi:Tc toxin complex TcA C-terminal TcB-binding domain